MDFEEETMMETLLLISGTLLLLLAMFDFFFTTLSSSGAGYISKTVATFGHYVMQVIVRLFGRRMYRFSGTVVNLLVLLVWVVIVWTGLFLLYSSDPGAITNSDGRTANAAERLYFTGYTLSTLGIGNFKPTTAFFEFLTSCFSFFGFIFFTSSMTYLISLSSANINKRALASSIHNLGKDPEAIAGKFLEFNEIYRNQQILQLQEKIDQNGVNHQAYPVVHFYTPTDARVSLSLNLARLDEAVGLLLSSGKNEELLPQLELLRQSVTYFLDHINENYPRTLPKEKIPVGSLPIEYTISGIDQDELRQRRRILGGFIRSEGFNWNDVAQNDSVE